MQGNRKASTKKQYDPYIKNFKVYQQLASNA